MSPAGGFALLLVVTLLAFLVLLLVSLATLTRVETSLAGNQQQTAQARQNALAALNIALGELQKYAGPDQRVTAPADLVADHDSGGNPTSAPAGLDVQNGTRHWTGVWGNGASSIGYSLTPSQISGRGTAPVLLNWLVSGNESASCSLTSTNGRVAAGTPPRFTPVVAVSNLDASTTPRTASRPRFSTLPAASDGVLLVGANSTSDGSQSGSAASFGRGDYVVAPLVDIRVSSSSVPGVSSSSDTLVGRYAWWIGDEGVKARINLQNGYQKSGAASDHINSFIVSQRDGVEFLDGADGSPVGTAYSFTNPLIPNLRQLNQLPLAGSDAVAAGRLYAAGREHFHDLTAHSVGVLADSYAGGLRKDLTADLADTSSDSSYRPADDATLFRPLLLPSGQRHLPTWGMLRSWARTRPDASGAVAPVPPTDTEAGVYPTISYSSLGFNYYLQGPDDTLKIALYPLVVLNNPYPFTIAAADYDLAFHVGVRGKINVDVDNLGNGAYTTIAVFDTKAAAATVKNPSPAPPDSYFRFKLHGSDIPPGESHIYLLPDSAYLTGYDPLNPAVLERAPDADSIGEANFVVLTGPDLGPLSPNVQNNSNIRLRALEMSGFSDPADRQPQLGVVLAKADSLVSGGSLVPWDPSVAKDWYQCVVNTLGGNYALVSNLVCDTSSTGSVISSRRALGTVPPIDEATSALRIGSVFQAQNFWSSSLRMGVPFTGTRPYAVANFRAPFIEPTYMESLDPALDQNRKRSGAIVVGATLGGAGETRNPHLYFTNDRYAANFGFWLDADSNQTGYNALHHSILFDLFDSPDRLLSLGQLQNAPFSRYAFQPTYPFGNSYADPRIARNATYRDNGVVPLDGGATLLPAYDLSWHLNRNLWDRYFVSGVPAGWTQKNIDDGKTLPNARLNYVHRDGAPPALENLRYTGGADNPAYDKAAANLLVEGSFNINSTSEQAWRAVLAGTSGLPADSAYAESGDAVDRIIPYPRFSHNPAKVVQSAGPYVPVTQSMVTENPSTYTQPNFIKTCYLGNRGLYLDSPAVSQNPSPQAVVAELARSIVSEIRKRGPSLCLADFINRPVTATNDPAGIKGTLQAGIDGMDPNVAQVNPYHWLTAFTYKGVALSSAFGFYPGWDSEHNQGGPLSEMGSGKDTYRARFSMAPKSLTQADLLSTLGPRLSARSDTFTIRTYGEVINPVTGEIESRAWCEAVVQRLPEYIDPAQSAESTPSGVNATFGRRFTIVSFRWLSPDNL